MRVQGTEKKTRYLPNALQQTGSQHTVFRVSVSRTCPVVTAAEAAKQLAAFSSKNRLNHAVLRAKQEAVLATDTVLSSLLAWRGGGARCADGRCAAEGAGCMTGRRAATAYMESGQGRCPVLRRSP